MCKIKATYILTYLFTYLVTYLLNGPKAVDLQSNPGESKSSRGCLPLPQYPLEFGNYCYPDPGCNHYITGRNETVGVLRSSPRSNRRAKCD